MSRSGAPTLKNRVKGVRFRLRPAGVPAASGYRRSVSPDKLMPENLLLLLCRPISNYEAAPQAKLCRRMELFIKSLPRTRYGEPFVLLSHPYVPCENNTA